MPFVEANDMAPVQKKSYQKKKPLKEELQKNEEFWKKNRKCLINKIKHLKKNLIRHENTTHKNTKKRIL